MPNPSMVRRKKGLFRSTLHQFLMIDAVRFVVAFVRYFYLVILKRNLKTLDLETSRTCITKNTIFHNLKGMRDLAVNRSHYLVRPLSIIETIDTDARILTIGPRTEGEILNLIAYGFQTHNITGLDLITYSPWIELGDMHRMHYADNAFDSVILGWVLAYSKDPKAAAQEVVRVTKPGGVVAVGVEYNPLSVEQIEKQLGYVHGHTKRIESCDAILGYFAPFVDNVYWYHPVTSAMSNQIGSLCVIFSVKK